MERNGTEWKKLIKHGTELLSRHKVLPRKLLVHAERFAHSFSWKRMGRQADYSFHSSYIVDKQYS